MCVHGASSRVSPRVYSQGFVDLFENVGGLSREGGLGVLVTQGERKSEDFVRVRGERESGSRLASLELLVVVPQISLQDR